MAEPVELLKKEQWKTNYLNSDRSVNVQEHMKKQKQLEESGLGNVEVMDRARAMGKDDFLKILITQLSHQDPTEPLKDQDFIAQMAQFSSLEQMQNMSKNMTRIADRQSMELVGKFVAGPDALNGDRVSGIATAIMYDDSGKVLLNVGERMVDVNDVKVISDPASLHNAAKGLEGIASGNTLLSEGEKRESMEGFKPQPAYIPQKQPSQDAKDNERQDEIPGEKHSLLMIERSAKEQYERILEKKSSGKHFAA